MPVYFIGYQGTEGCLIKIGVAKDIRRRRIQLQTGSPVTLEIMGWIRSRDDAALERSLHAKFKTHRERGEWFNLDPSEILPDLTSAGCEGFVAKNADAFEITDYDSDAVPEYMGVWKWGDFEFHECCPFCGCFCGMHYQEASCMYHCMNCDTLTDFSELSPQVEDEPH